MDQPNEGGLVVIKGKTTSAGFPHLCPYQKDGADREFCEETTANYQRNRAGCCGTNDNRNFKPCNSMLRRCIKCLSEGRGNRSQIVTDIPRGLCGEHSAGVSVTAEKTESRPPVVHRPLLSQAVRKIPAQAPSPKEDVKSVPPAASLPQAKHTSVAVIGPPEDFSLRSFAERMNLLTPRQREILKEVSEKGEEGAAQILRMAPSSLQPSLSAIAGIISLPTFRGHTGRRVHLLLEAWRLYEKLLQGGEIEAPTPEKQPWGAKKGGVHEQAVVTLMRRMDEKDKKKLLEIVRHFVQNHIWKL